MRANLPLLIVSFISIAPSVLGQIGREKHPINHDVVNEIKEKTKSWVPYDPKSNPLKELTHD